MAVQFGEFLVSVFTDEAAIEQTAAFYTRLGFVETFRTGKPGHPTHIEVRSAGLTIAVSSARIANDEFGLGVTPGVGSSDVVLWVEDVDAAHAEAIAAGGTPARAPAGHPNGQLRNSWVRDPSGHLVGLVRRVAADAGTADNSADAGRT